MSSALAQAARVLFDARVESMAAHVAGLQAFHLDDEMPHFEEIGRIVLAHVTGTLVIDLDLPRYPALRVLATSTGVQALRQSIAAALLAPLTNAFIATGTGTWPYQRSRVSTACKPSRTH